MVHVKIGVKNRISRYDFVKISDFQKNAHSWAENFQISKSFIFFSKIRIFDLLSNTLGKVIIWQKTIEKDSKSPPKCTSNSKKCESLISRKSFSRRCWAHTRISSTFYRKGRHNTYYKKSGTLVFLH